MRVLVAPDSYKGSLPARQAAAAIAAGWREARPQDEVVEVPLADGGEGTVEALRETVPEAEYRVVAGVSGPDGRPVDAGFLLLPDGSAVVELAASSGLPLMDAPDPLRASTRGLGQVLATAVEAGATRLVVGLGGSASTEGGAGALVALGVVLRDDTGRPVPDGGAGLLAVREVDTSRLIRPPAGGTLLLADVDNPLLGPRGASAVFGPQKGADQAAIDLLEEALAWWASLLGVDPAASGMGAAGGTAYGLAALWGAQVTSGSDFVAEQAGLDELLDGFDVVVTGEGSFDESSLSGKVVGGVLDRARRAAVPVCVVTGLPSKLRPTGVAGTVSLVDIAGSLADALERPEVFAREAGRCLAGQAERLTASGGTAEMAACGL